MSPFAPIKTYVETVVVPCITADIDGYKLRRDKAKTEFLSRMSRVRFLGGLAGAFLVASALRLDELLVVPFKLYVASVDAGLFAKMLNGTGILLGFFALWTSKGLNERGLLKGWTRYTKARQTLTALERELSDVIQRYETAYSCACSEAKDLPAAGLDVTGPAPPQAPAQAVVPVDPRPSLEAVVTAIFDVIQRARLVPVQETDQWAIDVMTDLTAYVKSAGDVGSISSAATSKKDPVPR